MIFFLQKLFPFKKVFVGISPSIPLMSYLRELLSASPTLYAATSWEADRSIGPCEKRWELGREGETGRRERSTFNRWRVNGSGDDVREPHRPTIPSTTTFSQLSSSHYHHLPLTTTHTHTHNNSTNSTHLITDLYHAHSLFTLRCELQNMAWESLHSPDSSLSRIKIWLKLNCYEGYLNVILYCDKSGTRWQQRA